MNRALSAVALLLLLSSARAVAEEPAAPPPAPGAAAAAAAPAPERPAPAAKPPADRETAGRLAGCSATYTTQAQILEAMKISKARVAATAQQFWDEAIARSDRAFTEERFTVRFKAYLEQFETVNAVIATDRDEAARRNKAFLVTLNGDMDACDALLRGLGAEGAKPAP
jgi:hypothetical protein